MLVGSAVFAEPQNPVVGMRFASHGEKCILCILRRSMTEPGLTVWSGMPTVHRIGRVLIRLFADDHDPPHFHVVTADEEVVISLADLSIVVGSLDRQSLKAALDWARRNREFLRSEWNRLNER